MLERLPVAHPYWEQAFFRFFIGDVRCVWARIRIEFRSLDNYSDWTNIVMLLLGVHQGRGSDVARLEPDLVEQGRRIWLGGRRELAVEDASTHVIVVQGD